LLATTTLLLVIEVSFISTPKATSINSFPKDHSRLILSHGKSFAIKFLNIAFFSQDAWLIFFSMKLLTFCNINNKNQRNK
jgi:hypothetical protein